MSELYGGVEAGGTKFVCAVGSGPDDLREEVRFPTTTPAETLARTIEYFKEQHAKTPLKAIGIGSFGPVDPIPSSPTYGYVTSTPKPGWRDVDFVGPVREALGLPIGFDTDVNAAALGEMMWGAGQGLENFIYLTVGTGVGGGGIVGGKPIHGMLHPEMGHIRVPRDRQQDPYEGCCAYHGDCLEGLACGKAIELRWGQKAQTLQADHPAWDLEAQYLALALGNYVMTLTPQRIILGGGVMQQPHLFPLVRTKLQQVLGDYVCHPNINEKIEDYIVPPGLGNQAGVLGSIALAIEAAK